MLNKKPHKREGFETKIETLTIARFFLNKEKRKLKNKVCRSTCK
jgi:hypothetical protein